MKKLLFIIALLALVNPSSYVQANEPDSAYIFAYATTKNHNKNGLHFAWSIDQEHWKSIGPEFAFVRSDYGRWGEQKKMFLPVIIYGADDNWHAIWSVNQTDPTFAYAKSPDLVRWLPQSYPIMSHNSNCLVPVIGTTGPWSEGSDYERGWELATELQIPVVDEHYYQAPSWFIHNQDYYDRYDRSKSKVYIGEYAAHLPGRPNNIETALLEALHLINVERNGDIVEMTSYAPLLAKKGHTQWNPDLIYFNNVEVKPTVSYYIQKLFGVNAGDKYITSHIRLSDHKDGIVKRVACSVVQDSKTGDLILKLVNLLPVEVNTNLNTETLNLKNTKVLKTVLAGTPDDKTARPVETNTTLSDINNIRLPAYSFTVLRIINNKPVVHK